MRQGILTIAIMIFLLGCSRKTDFLHHVVEQPSIVEMNHKIKDLEGNVSVDILWTIDNSGSMGNHQQQVIINSSQFINEFVQAGGLDWRMGLISTTVEDPPYVGMHQGQLLDSSSLDPIGMFTSAVAQLGIDGDWDERPFLAIQTALSKYPSFLRPGAVFALIVLTDTWEQSGIGADTFVKYLTHLKGSTSSIVFYGILNPGDWGCYASDDEWDYAGSDWEKLVNLVPSKVYKLCGLSFASSLANMGQDLITRLKFPFVTLPSRPLIETLKVFYLDQELPGGPQESGGHWLYDFDLNAVVFHDLDFAPGDEEEVKIIYEEVKK